VIAAPRPAGPGGAGAGWLPAVVHAAHATTRARQAARINARKPGIPAHAPFDGVLTQYLLSVRIPE
jgi:hypothetical protein